MFDEKFQAVKKGVLLADYRGRKGNILVVAPHPDDDVLGAGGTMAASSAGGKGVFALYITDGRGSPRKDPGITDQEMAALREREALCALRVLGAAGGFFLRKRSDELAKEAGIEEDLKNILQSVGPEEVILPAPYERHRTHQQCTRITVQALRGTDLKPALLGYSLWGSFWGEGRRLVRDITPFMKKKMKAIRCHASQTAYKNYGKGIQSKNNYEAVFGASHEIQESGYVETFLDMNDLLAEKTLTLGEFIRRDVEDFRRAFLVSEPHDPFGS